MPTFNEFSDPRLVALYDTLNPFVTDTDFYLRLAAELQVASILDVGCGMGLLARELAERGYRVIGVDLSSAMFNVARHRLGSEKVRWVEEDARLLGEIRDEAGRWYACKAQRFHRINSMRQYGSSLGASYKEGVGRLAVKPPCPSLRVSVC